jgi:GH25 family lysozyme M1 (1,4-beta-N-acetylmuramidase)
LTFQLIDLSNNNATPHWDAVKKAGIVGAWMKVTESASFIDQTWKPRAAAARKAGLAVGGYHFARPASGAGAAQATTFARQLGTIEPGDLKPVLDLEDTGHLSSADLRQWVHDFNQKVLALTGTGPIFYSYKAFIQGLAWTSPAGYGLWLADYGADDGHDHLTSAPAPWKFVRAHQYTSRGTVPGVAGYVDRTNAPSLNPLLAHPPQV